MEVLFLLVLVLATPCLLASLLIWACLILAARAEVLPPPAPEWQ